MTYKQQTKSLLQVILIAGFTFSFLAGCSRNFLLRKQKIDEKIGQTQQKLLTNELKQIESARGYVYGTGLMLDSTTNEANEIFWAKEFNGRARLTLGDPKFDEALYWKTMVEKLRSTNTLLALEGKRALDFKDSEVTALKKQHEGEIEVLKTQIVKKEVEATKAAGDATKYQWWVGWIKKICWIVGGYFFLMFGLQGLAAVYPAAAPITSALGGIMGIPVRVVTSVFPAVKETAKVVTTKVHEEVVSTNDQLISVVQQARAIPAVRARIEPLLREATDEDTRDYIKKRKYELEIDSAKVDPMGPSDV